MPETASATVRRGNASPDRRVRRLMQEAAGCGKGGPTVIAVASVGAAWVALALTPSLVSLDIAK